MMGPGGEGRVEAAAQVAGVPRAGGLRTPDLSTPLQFLHPLPHTPGGLRSRPSHHLSCADKKSVWEGPSHNHPPRRPPGTHASRHPAWGRPCPCQTRAGLCHLESTAEARARGLQGCGLRPLQPSCRPTRLFPLWEANHQAVRTFKRPC